MKRSLCATCVVIGAVLCTGCANVAPSPLNYSHARFDGCSRAEAFDATRRALSERYRIARSDADTGTITAQPLEMQGPAPGSRLGDLVKTPRRTRIRARAVVTGTDQQAEVWCKVVVDRFDQAGSTLFQRDASRVDDPSGTPADRGGARTAEQNQVWRTVGRDKAQERSILSAVREIVAAAPGVTPP